MSPTTASLDLTQFDVRDIPCREKHARIFRRWAELPVRGHFVLVNDHDPVPLYYQFAGQFPGAFLWEYLVAGPDEFQVKITRVAPTDPSTPLAPPPARACGAPKQSAPAVLDTRGLEPPEPMMRILAKVETLTGSEMLCAQTDRRPLHLYPELNARGIQHVSEEQADGSWLIRLQRG